MHVLYLQDEIKKHPSDWTFRDVSFGTGILMNSPGVGYEDICIYMPVYIRMFSLQILPLNMKGG